jgi:hypothetical protein
MTTASEPIEWQYSENRDSEFAKATLEDLELLAHDCDGDFAYWHVKRGKTFLAAGEVRSDEDPHLYHFDVGKERALVFARAILKAEEYNSIRDCEPCAGATGNEKCSKCHGFGFYKDRPARTEAVTNEGRE